MHNTFYKCITQVFVVKKLSQPYLIHIWNNIIALNSVSMSCDKKDGHFQINNFNYLGHP